MLGADAKLGPAGYVVQRYLVGILHSLLIIFRYFSGGVVKILVGPEAVEFDVHRELLCAFAPHISAKPCQGLGKNQVAS